MQNNGRKSPAQSIQRTRTVLCERQPTARSRITNGKKLLAHGNLGTWGRRFNDLVAIYITHLGGPDNVTAPLLSIVRRISTKDVELEKMERKLPLIGLDNDTPPWILETYQRVSNSQRRDLESIGLRRSARDITPNLQEYLRQTENEDAAS
jgi:hypothetical protein